MTTWKRPYRDPFRIATGFFALVGLAFACVLGVLIVIGHPTFAWSKVAAAAVMALFLTLVWRLHRTAVVISDSGVRVRWLLKTRTVRWHEINGFRFDDDVLSVDRLWIDLVDGRRMRTPVQRVARRLNGSQLSDGGTWLLYDAADDLLHRLQDALEARRAPA